MRSEGAATRSGADGGASAGGSEGLGGANGSLPPSADPGAARRLTLTLFAAQSLGSAGFLTAATVNALVAAELAGAAWAGVPTASYQIGAALAALLWGRLMDPLGRRPTLALGIAAGAGGAVLAAVAVVQHSFALLLLALPLMGMANAALQLGRFVAAEVHLPHERGRAIANVVLGGTVGAVCGPLIASPAGQLARERGLEELAGPYAATALLLLAGAALVARFLRPEPRDLARALAARLQAAGQLEAPAEPVASVLRRPGVAVAVLSMVFAQVTMVMLMVITALHMQHHHHSLGSISFVVSSHVVGMYAFSVVSGRLADRLGRAPVIAMGAVTLVAACLAAPLSPALVPLSLALFLLGLGWNFCYVGGSALLADHLRPAERARTQGVNDLLIAGVSACGSVASGLVFSALGYAVVGLLGAAGALVPLALVPRLRARPAASQRAAA